MGKGDKKSRRGKIIIGSSGVRRPKNKKKALVKVEAVPAAVVVKSKKVAEAPKAEPKPKTKAAEPVAVVEAAAAEPAAVVETDVAVAPPKAIKKAVKKTKAEDTAEKK